MEQSIRTIHLFAPIDQLLIELLKGLTAEEWSQQTVARLWVVKDVAAHLLDGNIRTLSIARDNYFGEAPGELGSYEDLVTYLNRLNAEWVRAAKRLSPAVLIEWLELTGMQYCDYLAGLDPWDKAIFPVAWAGEEESKNWMHIAREYTEKWLHQQQIREATNRPGLMTAEFFNPFINIFMLGLPHAFRNTKADEGTGIKISVGREIGGTWCLQYRAGSWDSVTDLRGIADAEIILEPEVAWKLFSKSIRVDEISSGITVRGNLSAGPCWAEYGFRNGLITPAPNKLKLSGEDLTLK